MPFPDAASARAAGYRACKQCRPDDAPAPPVTVRYGTGPTPIGTAFVADAGRGVCALYVLDDEDPGPGLDRLRRAFPGASLEADPGMADEVVSKTVDHLVSGRPLDDVALDLRGTPFQLRVWEAISAIPWGATTTYGDIALGMGLPHGAARAVGTACGTNPVSLIVPCHRVLRTGGGLGGYGWGLPRKRLLLDLERERSAYAAGSVTVLTAVP